MAKNSYSWRQRETEGDREAEGDTGRQEDKEAGMQRDVQETVRD